MDEDYINQRLDRLEEQYKKLEDEHEEEIDMLSQLGYQLKESIALVRQQIEVLINGLLIIGTPIIGILIKLLFDDKG